MLIGGSETLHVPLGFTAIRECPTCEKDQQFRLILDYKRYHVWHLFGAVSEKKFQEICDICHSGTEIYPATAVARLNFNPIPFLDRYGMALLFGGGMLLAVILGPQA